MTDFFKWLGLLVLVLLLVIVGWAAWYVFSPDEKLNPDIAAFAHTEPFNPEDNVYVAWAGLYAPADVQDIYDYGLKVISGEIEWDEENALLFQGDRSLFSCHGQQRPQKKEDEPCANADDIREAYELNRQLITRYKTFYRYGRHDMAGKVNIPSARGQGIISMHRLFAAYWPLLAEAGHGDEALEAWVEDTVFLQKVLGESHTLVEHAIWMVIYGINLDVLPVILEKNPALISKWEERLTALLEKDIASPDIWRNVMRGEYLFFEHVLDIQMRANFKVIKNELPEAEGTPAFLYKIAFKQNMTRNRIYEWGQSMIWLSRQPATDFDKQQESLEHRFPPYPVWTDNPFLLPFDRNVIGSLLIGGMTKGTELIRHSHVHNARSRMLILYMRAKAQGALPDSVQAFIEASGESLYDPFTGKPFRWDAQKKSIYFINSRADNRFEVYYDPLPMDTMNLETQDQESHAR
jgi:hypothetical protein